MIRRTIRTRAGCPVRPANVSDRGWFREECTIRRRTSVTTTLHDGRLGPVDHHGDSVTVAARSGGEVNGEHVKPTMRTYQVLHVARDCRRWPSSGWRRTGLSGCAPTDGVRAWTRSLVGSLLSSLLHRSNSMPWRGGRIPRSCLVIKAVARRMVPRRAHGVRRGPHGQPGRLPTAIAPSATRPVGWFLPSQLDGRGVPELADRRNDEHRTRQLPHESPGGGPPMRWCRRPPWTGDDDDGVVPVVEVRQQGDTNVERSKLGVVRSGLVPRSGRRRRCGSNGATNQGG